MSILKTATDWARVEIFSTSFFIVFGVVFLLASVAFWQLGKTDIAKAYVISTAVVGVILIIIGVGLSYTNYTRVTDFEVAYTQDAADFVTSEIARAEATLKEYQLVVFKIIPVLIAICALLIIVMDAPMWRASLITTIAMLAVILLIDGTAHSRIEIYYHELLAARSN